LASAEESKVRICFVIAVNVSIAAFAAVVSRRILFAGFATALLVTLVKIVSTVKIRTMDMSLHAYDIFLYVNWQTLTFLWSEYRSYLVWALGAGTDR
jgi:hypothetical protein